MSTLKQLKNKFLKDKQVKDWYIKLKPEFDKVKKDL